MGLNRLLLCTEQLLGKEQKKAFVIDVACSSNCPENVVVARGQTVFLITIDIYVHRSQIMINGLSCLIALIHISSNPYISQVNKKFRKFERKYRDCIKRNGDKIGTQTCYDIST